MINNVNNATSFKASYVDKINIQKLNSRKKYVPYQANLVELNRSDLKALEEIRTKWKNSWLCGKFISWAEKMHSSSDKAFALTTQKENFENLQEKYKDKWEPIGPEAGKHKLLWMLGEVGEVIDIMKKNGDKTAVEDAAIRQHLVEEMADVLMYYNDALLCYGISERELKEAYTAKFEKNMTRW